MGPPVPVNEIEVTAVNDDAAELGDYKNGLADINGVGKGQNAAGQTQMPERKRNDAAFHTLTGDPLHKKPRTKNQLPQKTNRLPYVHGQEPCEKPTHKMLPSQMAQTALAAHTVFIMAFVYCRPRVTHLQPGDRQ